MGSIVKRISCLAAFAALTSPAAAQDHYRSEALSRDSAFETNGDAFFVRGGYAFDSTEEITIAEANAALAPFGVMVAGNPGDEVFDTSAFYASLGFRQKLKRFGDSMLSVEEEFLAARSSESVDILGVPVAYREWDLFPNAALRWQYNFNGAVAPYASLGAGPGIILSTLESGASEVSETDVVFAYTGRAGLEFNVTPRFGVEAGYRYLGVTDATTAGFHAAEIGLNFKF